MASAVERNKAATLCVIAVTLLWPKMEKQLHNGACQVISPMNFFQIYVHHLTWRQGGKLESLPKALSTSCRQTERVAVTWNSGRTARQPPEDRKSFLAGHHLYLPSRSYWLFQLWRSATLFISNLEHFYGGFGGQKVEPTTIFLHNNKRVSC